jgi:antitoxin CcdA
MNDITIDPSLLEEAKLLNVDIARAAAQGIADAVKNARAIGWRDENAAALRSSNLYVETNGLPLGSERLF